MAKLFTGVITNWDDPEIAKSNPEVHLPNLAVRPVVRSDGSGTSAQFTAFMASQTPAVYQAFCKKVSLNPCLPTSLYPELPGQYAEVGSDGVANTVAATYENGAIGYVEYGYAKERGFPVASVLNHAGYYTQPSSFDVAVALAGRHVQRRRHAELGGRVHVQWRRREVRVSGVELLVPDRAHHHRVADDHGEGRADERRSSCTPSAPGSRSRRSSATRRCPRTS